MLLVEEMVLPNQKKVSLHLEKGCGYGLTGPNGCGKSLLLKSLAHLLPVSFKSFIYNEKSILDYGPELYRSRVLYLPSVPVVSDQVTVEQYLSAPLKLAVYKKFVTDFPANDYLLRFQLQNKNFAQLSSGQKQVLSFLRAMTLKAEILLLDEPTSHLDSNMTRELESMLQEWKSADPARSYLLVSHQDEQVKRLASKVLSFEHLVCQLN